MNIIVSSLSIRYDGHQEDVRIVLVGKYTKFQDSYISVIKALRHAALSCRRKLDLKVLEYCRVKSVHVHVYVVLRVHVHVELYVCKY